MSEQRLEHFLPPQFVNYRLQWNTQAGKYDKLPCDAQGANINAQDPTQWVDYDTAVSRIVGSERGVGFVFSANDPWFFLDLDGCLIDGQWTQAAVDIFQQFPGAMYETSVSGTGLHIIGQCHPTLLADRKNRWDGWIEFYTHSRFMALGPLGFKPVGERFVPEIDWTPTLIGLVPQRAALGELAEGVHPDYTGPQNDEELIAKALRSRGGMGVKFQGKATFKQLWEADAVVLGGLYPDLNNQPPRPFDHSAADAALHAQLAFWTGNDMPRMERLFRRSGLMRPKYDRASYRKETIEGAVRMTTRVYDKQPEATPGGVTINDDVYMPVHRMEDHFKGCVYVTDQHCILTPDGTLMDPSRFNAVYGGYIFQMNPDGTQPEKKAFTAFTENRTLRFPKVRTTLFDPEYAPGEIVGDTVNVFFPPDREFTPGNIDPFWDFFQRIMPDQGDREIMLAWMASCVQNPHKKFQWAPVLQGTEGNGKTFLMECVAHGIGERYVARPDPDKLGAMHNGWMEFCLFAIVEEVHMRGRREILDGLKARITNAFISIRAMRDDERTVKNFTKWGFCTNYMDAVLKNQNDRRYAIFFTAQQSYSDIEKWGLGGDYFPTLYNWARGGGYSAVAHFLMNHAIPDHLNPATLCHRAPNTSSTAVAIEKSAGILETEILEATQDNTPGFRGGYISSIALENLAKVNGLRIGRSKRSEALLDLGYVKHPSFHEGRFPHAIFSEGNKRPIIYVREGFMTTGDASTEARAYLMAQGFSH